MPTSTPASWGASRGRIAAVRTRLADAVVRGEVHADIDPDRLVEVIGGATLMRILLWPEEPFGGRLGGPDHRHRRPRCGRIAEVSELLPFPSDWDSALVLVPHPDDPEYGVAAAVAKWTASGKTVRYALASRGEVGIEGMPAEQAGPLREGEQRRSAAIVGVEDVRVLGLPGQRHP